MRNLRGLVLDTLLWCLLAIALVAGLSNAAAIGQYPPVSLRFDTQISGKTAYSARQYSIAHSEEDVFWPTFWREDKMTFTSEHAAAEADYIAFSGEAALVWPAAYLYGTAPGVADGMGCALSSALAWELWGGTDVVGETLDAGGETRVVRGVFESESVLALVSFRDEDTSQSWSAAELSGGPQYATRDDAKSYASAAGLGRSLSVLVGSGTTFFSGFLAALPLIILAAYFLALIAGLLKKYSPVLRGLILFLLLLVFALSLSAILGSLPVWLIPTRWSDFSFWSDLIGQIKDALREYLAVSAKLRDVACRQLLLKQAAIAFFSVCCALAICFHWDARRRPLAKPDVSEE